jgi:FkbM family methyltransferase
VIRRQVISAPPSAATLEERRFARAGQLMLRHPRPRTALPSVERVGGQRAPASFAVLRAALRVTPASAHHFLRRAAARVIVSRRPDLIFRYSDGRAFLVPADDRTYISVLTLGAYEPFETHVVQQLLGPGDFAIDVGANYGWFSAAMATAVAPGGCVWAVEPTPPVLHVLQANVQLNSRLPIRVIPIALGRTTGRVGIHFFSGLPAGHASVSTLGRNDFDVYECEIRSLDSLLRGAAQSPALIKLDVEGSELAILEGSDDTLRTETAPIWLIEVNYETTRALGYQPKDLLPRLRRFVDYDVFRIEANGLVAERNAERAPHGSSWLCVPSSRVDRLPRSLLA